MKKTPKHKDKTINEMVDIMYDQMMLGAMPPIIMDEDCLKNIPEIKVMPGVVNQEMTEKFKNGEIEIIQL